jgi:hypothetical protein
MSNSHLQTIDLDQLALVAGGQDNGTWEQRGRQVGQVGGQVLANMAPPALQPAAQAVLPPTGREVGGWVGRQVDNITSRLPQLPW